MIKNVAVFKYKDLDHMAFSMQLLLTEFYFFNALLELIIRNTIIVFINFLGIFINIGTSLIDSSGQSNHRARAVLELGWIKKKVILFVMANVDHKVSCVILSPTTFGISGFQIASEKQNKSAG